MRKARAGEFSLWYAYDAAHRTRTKARIHQPCEKSRVQFIESKALDGPVACDELEDQEGQHGQGEQQIALVKPGSSSVAC